MGKVITITSGKGGVGKTTSSANIATGLAKLGHKVVVVDFDVGLRNLDTIMGCERRVIYDMVNYLRKDKSMKQILVQDKKFKNLFILPTSQTEDKDIFKEFPERTKMMIDELKDSFDYVILDSPAGIESGAMEAMKYCDEAIVACNPEISSVRDSDKMIGLVQSKHFSVESGDKGGDEPVPVHILITRFANDQDCLTVEDIKEILSNGDEDPIGIIPNDTAILDSSNRGVPVVVEEASISGKAYMDTAKRIAGEDIPLVIHREKKGFWNKLTKR